MTRVLVVDDEPQNLRALRINLRPAVTTWGWPAMVRTHYGWRRARAPISWCSTSACPTRTACR
jgi:hypothetical protein